MSFPWRGVCLKIGSAEYNVPRSQLWPNQTHLTMGLLGPVQNLISHNSTDIVILFIYIYIYIYIFLL